MSYVYQQFMTKGYQHNKTSVHLMMYHFIWIPKRRKKILVGKIRNRLFQLIQEKAKELNCDIIRLEIMSDHIHLCVSIPPKYSVAHTIGLLKGKSASEVMSFGTKSSRMVRGRTFWARGYCVSTVGLDEEMIREYIRNQEKMDMFQEDDL